MKSIWLCLVCLAVSTASVIPKSKPVPIHHINEWRQTFPELAELMPIENSDSAYSSRIAGGLTPNPAKPAYHAQIISTFSDGAGLCGGSILSETWILTVAHCTDPAAGIIDLEVYVGSHNRLELDVDEQHFHPIQNIIHPGWNSSDISNNIAILEVDTITYGASIIPILFVSPDYPTYEGSIVRLTGFGRTGDDPDQGFSDYLQFIEVPVISNEACKEVFPMITDSNICTSGEDGRNARAGDGGGPVVQNSMFQVGIISFGSAGGCTLGYPTVNVRVAFYYEWIKEQTGLYN